MKLSIVIPVYNEHDTIHTILDRVRAVKTGADDTEIIIVDDASQDGTPDRIREYTEAHPVAKLVTKYCPVNRGKGAALREGIALASGDIIVIQDADLEYDPKDIAALIAPILNNDADVVYGSRFLG
ncbi:MAG: glycosyltransferase family 2 protein, partial [Candidatus Hydrogenedentota bacterium]